MTVPNFRGFAYNENYSTQSDIYDGTPTKVDPSAIAADGFRPGGVLGAQHINFLFNEFGQSYGAWLIENLFGSFVQIAVPDGETQRLNGALVWFGVNLSGVRSYVAPTRFATYGASGADAKVWQLGAIPRSTFGTANLIPSGDTTLRAADVASVFNNQGVLVQSASSTSGTALSIFDVGSSSPWTHRNNSIFDGAGCDRVHYDGVDTIYCWRTTDARFFTNDSLDLESGTFTQDNSNITHIMMASLADGSGVTIVAEDINTVADTVRTQRIDTPFAAVTTSVSEAFRLWGLTSVGNEFIMIIQGSSDDSMIVLVSDDNGSTWSERFRETGYPTGSLPISHRNRAFVLGGWLLVFTDAEILASLDAGRSWYRAPHNVAVGPQGRWDVVNGKVYYSDLVQSLVSIGRLAI